MEEMGNLYANLGVALTIFIIADVGNFLDKIIYSMSIITHHDYRLLN